MGSAHWARPVASKLSERRPLTFFHRRDTENGQKRYFFAFLQITPMQKISGGIPGCHMKADVLAIPKMWWFFILHFFKPKLLLPKVGSNLMNYFGKIAVLKKKDTATIFPFDF